MPAVDPFASTIPGIESFGNEAFAISPHDTNELSKVVRSIWVGVAGDIAVVTVDGSAVTFTNVPVGWFDCKARVKQVKDTGTDADEMIGVP